jgi:ParB family chromosome partitioning protein
MTKTPFATSRPEPVQILDLPLSHIDESDRFRLRTPPYPKLDELAQDIRAHGQTTPIFVRSFGTQYELISGYRRFAALQMIGAKTALARVYELDDDKAFELALSENRERDALTEIERADAALRLHRSGYTTSDVARHIGCVDRQASNYLRLAREASPPMREALQKGQLSFRAALELLVSLDGVPSPDHEALIARIVSEELSGKRLTAFLRGHRPSKTDGRSTSQYVRPLPNGGFAIHARLDPADPEKMDEVLAAISSAIQASKKLARSQQRHAALIATLTERTSAEPNAAVAAETTNTKRGR